MAKKITSGPFFVPVFLDGTSPLYVDRLLIGFKNVGNERSTVHVTVRVCREVVFYPETPPEVTIYQQTVDIPGGDCAVLRLFTGNSTFQGNNMLRVIVEGDIYKDGKGVLVALSGGTEGRSTVSMVFKHSDFIKLE